MSARALPVLRVQSNGHYLHLDINMCSWENLLIQNPVQEIDGGGPGGDGFNSIWGEGARVRWLCYLPATELLPQKSQTK